MRRAFAMLLLALMTTPALAQHDHDRGHSDYQSWASGNIVRVHGEAEWIAQQQWKNQIGELCCGERDCSPLDDGDVAVTPAGYYVKSLKETVPFSEALPAPAEAGGALLAV